MYDNLTAIEAIGLGIRSEEDAAEFYGSISKKMKNALVKSRFESLARDEMGHRKLLVDLYKKSTGEDVPSSKIPGQPQTAEQGGVAIDIDSMEEVIKYAITRENDAEKFYRKIAEKSKDISGKRTFEYLAEIEHGHGAMLETELEIYLKDRDWYADNPDIQLVGP